VSNRDKPRKQRRQQHARRSKPALPPGFFQAEPPPKRLPVLFQMLDEITRTVDLALATGEKPRSRDELFDLAVLVRANNLVKASRTLFADGHWEIAASAARQLFELLLNVEYLLMQPDLGDARPRYAKFGLLQYALSRLRELEYDRSAGHPVDNAQASAIREPLAGPAFNEFKARDGRWKTSWSGKSTKTLADLSSDPMCLSQYEQLFVAWSEETHAAPVALLEGILPKQEESWIERQIARDDREIGQMTLMLVVLFLEMWELLPAAPPLDPEVALGWITPLRNEAMA
jgi:hypothetical protein